MILDALFPLNERLELNASKLHDLAPLSLELLEKENAELAKRIKQLAKKQATLEARIGKAKGLLYSPSVTKIRSVLAEASSYITYLHNKRSSSEVPGEKTSSSTLSVSPPQRFVSIVDREEIAEEN